MKRQMHRLGTAALGALLAMTAMVSAASAGPVPQAVERVVTIRADCPSYPDQPGKLVFHEGWLSSFPVTGNRTAYVIDGARLDCTSLASFNCGTGGCPTTVMVLEGDRSKIVFNQQLLDWTRPARGAAPVAAIDIQLHGVFCGKTGSSECPQRLDLLTGKLTELPARRPGTPMR